MWHQRWDHHEQSTEWLISAHSIHWFLTHNSCNSQMFFRQQRDLLHWRDSIKASIKDSSASHSVKRSISVCISTVTLMSARFCTGRPWFLMFISNSCSNSAINSKRAALSWSKVESPRMKAWIKQIIGLVGSIWPNLNELEHIKAYSGQIISQSNSLNFNTAWFMINTAALSRST